MITDTTPPCANCQRLQAEVAALRTRLEALHVLVAQLQAQLAAARKDSSTSSKPPSSDLVKPPKPAPPGADQRQRGGQPGHPKHQRPLVPPDLLTAPPHDSLPEICPDCGTGLRPAAFEPRLVQQIEIPRVP